MKGVDTRGVGKGLECGELVRRTVLDILTSFFASFLARARVFCYHK